MAARQKEPLARLAFMQGRRRKYRSYPLLHPQFSTQAEMAMVFELDPALLRAILCCLERLRIVSTSTGDRTEPPNDETSTSGQAPESNSCNLYPNVSLAQAEGQALRLVGKPVS
ncbi:MAG: hypothetical protein LQ347_001019 [Umbilicaria vellea]|nr:MAG: hypothetical protein LQ347_001019 [Umbilicaria vellea]